MGIPEEALVHLGSQSVLRSWPQGIGDGFVVIGKTIL